MNYNRKEVKSTYKVYLLDNEYHRTDGPAIEFVNGRKEWWIHNRLHRLDGPAVECTNGCKEWWVHGNKYSEQSFYNYINNLKIPEYFNELQ